MKSHYRMFAGYNAWCNERLYAAAATLTEPTIAPTAAPSSSRCTARSITCWSATAFGCSASPVRASCRRASMPFCSRISPFRAARRAEDASISRYVQSLSDDDLGRSIHYRTVGNPTDIEQVLAPALDHFFNHQTHHRGQAHALLSPVIGNDATPSFDLIIYQRETGQGGLRKLS